MVKFDPYDLSGKLNFNGTYEIANYSVPFKVSHNEEFVAIIIQIIF
jgi:hypothetical protein